MARRWRHHSKTYRGRKCAIRREGDVAELEKMVRADYEDIWREHIEDLEAVAEDIQYDADMLVPRRTGALQSSINVQVSRSNRYPGIIAHASATNEGYDYAVDQELNEEYQHSSIEVINGLEVESEDERVAHYLGGSFAFVLNGYYEDITGNSLEMSEDLEHAMDYVSEYL